VPSGWQTMRLKYLIAAPITDGPHTTPEFISEGVPFLSVDGIQDGELVFENCRFVSRTDHSEFRRKAAPRKDDILIGKAASTGKIARVKDDTEFSIWSPLALIRPDLTKIHSAFLEYGLKSPMLQSQIDDLCTSNTQKNISMADLPRLVLPLPSLEYQSKAVEFLDAELSQINSLIADKERMLALLDEKRAALINQVVRRGLDPTGAYKASGEPWLGEVPSHWRVIRAKAMFREVDDRTPTGEETLLSLRMGKGLVPHHDVSGKPLEPSDVVGFKRVKSGQMVINRMRAASGLIAVADQPGLVSPDYAVFDVLGGSLCIEYFLELFKTPLLQAVFRSSSKGLGTGEQGFLRLYSDAFLSLHFPYPPEFEQRAIADFIGRERKEFQSTEELLVRSIELAKERRSALISAAVTGQIPLQEMAG
jgi:type I restriction enzyme S subunit